jgi:hypothetical protein
VIKIRKETAVIGKIINPQTFWMETPMGRGIGEVK